MPRLAGPLTALFVAAGVAAPAPASAACAAAVVVDGQVLLGGIVRHPDRLPPRGAERTAISPACNDTGGADEPNTETTVSALRGLPATVAVTGTGDRDVVYTAPGSLVVSADHPLHLAVFGSRRVPSTRDRHQCRREPRVMRGVLADDPRSTSFDLRRTDRTVTITVDAATRLANRPAHQPLVAGQRVALRTSICGPRRVADAIRFVGADARPRRSRLAVPEGSTTARVGLAAGAAALMLVVAGGARRWAGRRR